jgi:hypothetical protein
MDQMILSEPSTIIIWTYQGRMEWMSIGYWLEKWLVLMRNLAQEGDKCG